MPLKKNIKCSKCGKRIRGTKDVGFKERMAKLRRHRKKYHPKAHRKSIKKALKTKREKGIINKSKKPKKPAGKGWKWNPRVGKYVRRKKKGRGFEFK